MRGSLTLNRTEPESLSPSSTSEAFFTHVRYLVHPAQIPGKFIEVWGFYVGAVGATIRLRLEPSDPTLVTGEELISIHVSAQQGFFYGAAEREITEQAFLIATGQTDSVDNTCVVNYMIIQLSCEERPDAPPDDDV